MLRENLRRIGLETDYIQTLDWAGTFCAKDR
jgi:hypothetical protein